MPVRADQQVSGRIGIEVEHGESKIAAVHDEPFPVFARAAYGTLGSNLLASAASTLWIYFIAPPLGMLLAAEWFVRRHGQHHVRCATLHHRHDRCIFHCSHMETS